MKPAGLFVDTRLTYVSGFSVEAAFEAPPGVTVLFGPSGCGKTTLMRQIAGLLRPYSGSIRLGADVWDDTSCRTHIPPQKRKVGYLPQEGLLFPHLNVAHNIEFGLKGWPSEKRKQRVRELLELLGLADLAHRRPSAISGGQRQRAALGRALAPFPRVLLLDEPLSALDRPEQRRLRDELQGLLPGLDIPCLWITHNRHEAHAIGHNAVVMDSGKVLQSGEIVAVMDRPSHPHVARLFGYSNIIPGEVTRSGEHSTEVQSGTVTFKAMDSRVASGPVWASFRGEDVLVAREPKDGEGWNCLPAVLSRIEDEGPLVRLVLEAGLPMEARATRESVEDAGLASGDQVWANIRMRRIHLIQR